MSRPTSKFAAGFLITAVLVSLVILFQPAATSNIAFAKVLDQLNNFRTVTFTVTVTKGNHTPPPMHFMMGADRVRAEIGNDKVSIGNTKRGEFVFFDHAAKSAIVVQGMNAQPNIIEKLRQLKDEQGVPVGEREIAGVKTNGFKVITRNEAMTIFADVNTGLPILIEIRVPTAEPDSPPSGTVHDFVYDQPLDATLFEMTIPGGYSVQKTGGVPLDQQQPPATPKQAKALTITPLIGFTNAKFGATKEQVLAALGKPGDIQHDVDLRYLSKGFAVAIFPKTGFHTINCFSKAFAGPFALNDFPGQTDKGIRIGSTRPEIEAAYGKPDKVDQRNVTTVTLEYTALNTTFTLINDKVANMLFFGPRPQSHTLVITPLDGFPMIKFGSTHQQIVEAIGKPDITQRDNLIYIAKGLTMTVDPNIGLQRISCIASDHVVSYPGQTDKGICIGSTSAEIEAAYGQPDNTLTHADGQTTLLYEEIKTQFLLRDDQVTSMYFSSPPPKPDTTK